MVAVSVRGIEKRFGATTVLRGIDVDVPRGAFAVLVGPSGCGKSTLLRLLAGLERADGGTICFDGRDVTRLEPRDRDVAMVFQSYALYPHLSVRDNLAFGLRLRKVQASEIARRVAETAQTLGLEALLDRFPKALSGGQRQRVAMGRAIVRRPSLFLFDEPLSNLDAALRSQVRVDIRTLHDRLAATSVYVTHDQVEAMTLADVLFVLNRGIVEQAGAPLEVYARPATRFVASFLGSPTINFLEATLKRESGRWVAACRGLAIAVDTDDFAGSLEEGRAVIVGARPHDVDRADSCGKTATILEVAVVEALGTESFVHGSLAGAPFVARLPPGSDVQKGSRLGIMLRRIHLFDAKTGLSLRAP